VAAKLSPGKAETLGLDASDCAALVKAAKGVDFVLNALATAWDLPVMEACLAAGRHYLDMGAGGPRDITGVADLDEQLALDDELDTVESLTVLDGDNGVVDGYELACSFSVETMIEECLPPPYVFRDGREERNEPLSVLMEKVGLAVGVMDLPADWARVAGLRRRLRLR
jgi:saccharopine dehydrogenase-like NADP-dependent oxidoreductase